MPKLQSNLYLKTVKDHFNVKLHSTSVNKVLPDDSSARIIVLTERQYESMILISCEKSNQEVLVGAQRQLVFNENSSLSHTKAQINAIVGN